MKFMNVFTQQRIFLTVAFLVILAGVFFRFYQINTNTFIYYDEGMWLNQNRDFIDYMSQKSRADCSSIPQLVNVTFHLSLQTAKSLWAFIAAMRGLVSESTDWAFTRFVSALFGTLTIVVVFLFTRRFYQSIGLAVLAAAFLAIFPSHVYYSRIGLQETISAFLFLAGLHLYLYQPKLNYRVVVSGFLFSLIFFVNYRMIIIPLIIGFAELYLAWAEKRPLDWRKYLWNSLTFLTVVFSVGSLDQGANTRITFAWIFHQAHLAQGSRSLFNFLSYPYYLFRLESIPFGFLFFTSAYFFAEGLGKDKSGKKPLIHRNLFPFWLVVFLMIIFSFPQDKAARYLCVGMPLMAIATAVVCRHWWARRSEKLFQSAVIVLVVLMTASHVIRSNTISRFRNDYETSIHDIKSVDPSAKFLSTQSMIQSLFVKKQSEVLVAPQQLKFLLMLFTKGYRYLVIDPQAYVSYTQDKNRFTQPLSGYFDVVQKMVKPIKTYQHFSYPLLERFVFEHNENLSRSIAFLRNAKLNHSGELKVYDLHMCLPVIKLISERGLYAK
jgi:hypothetical protein